MWFVFILPRWVSWELFLIFVSLWVSRGAPFSDISRKVTAFSLKLETSDFDWQYYVFYVFPGSGTSPERRTNEKSVVWMFLFFSVLKGTLLNHLFLSLVWFLVSFWIPGTDQKRGKNIYFTKNWPFGSRDRPGFRFEIILGVFFVFVMCCWSHSRVKRVFFKNTLVKQMKMTEKETTNL